MMFQQIPDTYEDLVKSAKEGSDRIDRRQVFATLAVADATNRLANSVANIEVMFDRIENRLINGGVI